jgi:hypothetical protein
MSIHDRIEDSQILFSHGRLHGALLSVLIAVAATSRTRYPRGTPSLINPKDKRGMGDREAFVKYLSDERQRLTPGMRVRIEFEGEFHSLEEILYEFMRSHLVHEGALHDRVHFEQGEFLLDKRGTRDELTFSTELMIRLAYVVETSAENLAMKSPLP